MKNYNHLSTNSAFPLRSKFIKLLHEAGIAENSLDDAFVQIELMSSDALLKILWDLSFSESQESALNELNLVSKEDYVSTHKAYIPQELVIPFRNELRYQYSLIYTDFLTFNTNSLTEYAPIFEQFVKEMGMDKILSSGLAIMVFNFLSTYLWKDESYVDKAIFLLNSHNDNFIHGGLRSIGLNRNEAQELSHRAKAIAKLIDAVKSIAKKNSILPLVNEFFINSISYENQSRNWTTPMANLATMLKDKGFDLPDDVQPDETNVAVEPDKMKSHETDVLDAKNSSAETRITVPTIVGIIAEDSDDTADSKSKEFSSTPNTVNPRTINQENTFKAVTPLEVLQNMAVLKEFIHVADKVTNTGFNVKEVLEKLSAIRKILDGFEALG